MPTKLKRGPWKRQPQIATRINWASPLARGLVFCAPLHPRFGFVDLVQGQTPTRTGMTGTLYTPNGMYPVFGSSSYLDYPTLPAGLTGSTPCTIAWTQFPNGTTAYSTVLNVLFTGQFFQFVIYESNQAAYHFVAGTRDGGNLPSFDAVVGAQTDGVLDRYVLQLLAGPNSNTASNSILWRNGVRLTTSSTIAFSSSASAVFRVGALDSASDPFEGALGNLSIWNRVVSDAEAFALSNPGGEFAVLLPLSRRLFVPQASAGGVTGTVAYTNANDTSSAAGTTTVTGALAKTNANDTCAAAGSVGNPVTGTVAYTNANDTSAAAGTTTVTGTLARANANDTAAAAGFAGSVTGTVAVTNANDTCVASGTAAGSVTRGGTAEQWQYRRLMIESESDVLALLSTILASGVLEEVD